MLSRLLESLREGGIRRTDELAQELGTTPQLVEVMLEDLARMGYVRRIGAECSSACTRCLTSDRCAAGGPSGEASGVQLWVLRGTDKQ